MLLTITNLYPRPDEPDRGLFNRQLFDRLSRRLTRNAGAEGEQAGGAGLTNICLVPSWKRWLWPVIRAWGAPRGAAYATRYLPVFYIPVVGRNLNWATYRHALRRVAGDARACSAIFATWLYPDAVAAADLARVSGKPLWIKLHGGDIYHLDNRFRRKRIIEAFDQATGIVCVSQLLEQQVTQAGVDAAKVHVVPNGVDTGMFYCGESDVLPESFKASVRTVAGQRLSSGKLVLYVGHLVKIKGPDSLIESWKRMQDMPGSDGGTTPASERPMLLIVGAGPWRNRIERQVRRLGVEDSVAFLGVRPHAEVGQWMRLAHCLCLPSRSEGMPNVVLESLACGTPVVASAVGAVPALVNEGVTGRIVDRTSRDFTQLLAQSLHTVLSQQWDRDSIASTVRCYTWEKAADSIASLLGNP